MNTLDTIIAPATPPGDGGIAILRISGASALPALIKYFSPSGTVDKFESHRFYHGLLYDQAGELLDEVMAVYMAAPRTYTVEDVVEIHSHGSRQIVKSILDLYCSSGIRLAHPGEFTYRAYMNGRLDLSQAEAVAQLIHSKTASSHKLALAQVDGVLSREIYAFSVKLKHVLVLTEAWIDFPDEDLPSEDLGTINKIITDVRDRILIITDSYSSGRVLSEGASILLVGKPNVGKSSLLNALLGEDRAIVTSVPGTTRDILDEGMTIGGVPVRLIDTAGLRETIDAVEVEGIRRVKGKVALVDLILLVMDGSNAPDKLDYDIYDLCVDKPTILVANKDDISITTFDNPFPGIPYCKVSAKTGAGLSDLRFAIEEFLVGEYLPGSDSVLLSERRHYESLFLCIGSIDRALSLLKDALGLELLAFELREALYYLGQISGETTSESLLDDIFSGFCIGK